MYTVGATTKTIQKKSESWAIFNSWVAAVAMPVGTIVKLDTTTGEVTPVTAVTDVPLGPLEIGAANIGDRVTVLTPFSMICRGKASGAVTLGARVAAEAMDSGDEGLMKYKVAVAGNPVAGIALSAGADTVDIWVGILRMAVPLPA